MSESAEEVQYELDVGDSQETIVDLEQDASEDSSQDDHRGGSDNEPQASGSEDEMEQYSESVQKRINRLTKKMREAERQREEAIKYAQNVQTEAQQIRQRMTSLDQGYMSEYGQRLLLQQQQVENELRRAVEMGDSNATVEAQKKLTQLSIAANNYSNAQRQQASQASQAQYAQQQQQYSQQQAQPTAQQQQAAKRADPKAEQWAEKNSWFGKDEAMTFAAFGIHKKLVEDEGFDPQTNDYYNELDNRIKREFPHKFGDVSGSSRRPAQTVAGVSRTNMSSGRSNRRVKLSPSQVAIAKKLGVPLEEYAKYVKE
jgi:type II secretory pathway pseudopilin PulG